MRTISHRIPHIMAKSRAQQNPSNLLFFDTETKDKLKGKGKGIQHHSLWFGMVWAFRYETGKVTRAIKKRFETKEQFFNILHTRLDKSRPLYVFAHNVAFDLTQVDFWNYSDELGMKFNYTVLEDPPIMINVSWEDCKFIILDTFNFWKCPVSAMGKSLGIDKLPMPADNATKKKWDDYCLRDVEILGKQVMSLLDFLREEDLGSFGISAPSISMSCFKHSFMKHEIFIHDRNSVLELERESYYGGLVNNFYVGRSGGRTLYHYDVNSLYPSVMVNPYPVKMVNEARNPQIRDLARLSKSIGGCAKVLIKTSDRTYPKRIGDRLCDVKGSYWTYLCGEELQQAYYHSDIAAVSHLSLYEMETVFLDYVNYFWGKRREYKIAGDSVKDGLMKLFMNSLYGRFGMRGFDWIDYSTEILKVFYELHGAICPDKYLAPGYEPAVLGHTGDWFADGINVPIKLRLLGGKLEIKMPSGEHSESFCAIAGFVTSYARCLLRRYINIAGINNVFYCDTDSLFVNYAGKQRLIKADLVDEFALGKLKLEGESDKWAFYGPKDYEFGDKVAMKGIKKNAKKLAKHTFEQDQFERLKSVLKRGGEDYIVIKKIQKTIKREITKGVKQHNGRVTPIILHEH